MRTLFENIIRLVLLVLVQVLLLNNLQLLPFCNPYLYILFILALPVSLPRWADVLLAFGLGITLDIFSDTPGLHSFACTLIGYLRYYVIKLFVADEERINDTPSFSSFGIDSYIKYVVVLTLIHHTSLFLLEAFTFTHWWWLLLRIVASSAVSIGIILGIEAIRSK